MRLNRLVVLIPFLLILASCQDSHELAGAYQARDAATSSTFQLVLGPDGKGHWTVSREEISFSWEKRGDEVWLHSRTGGVIVGKVGKDDCIDVALPGVGKFRFEKAVQ